MNAFVSTEIKNLLKVWKGKVEFKRDAAGKVTQIELSKKYELDLKTEQGDYEQYVISKVLSSYDFLTLSGDRNTMEVKISVKPSSLGDFRFLHRQLHKLEANKQLLSIKEGG